MRKSSDILRHSCAQAVCSGMKERFTFTAEDTGIQVRVLDNVPRIFLPSLVTVWIPDNFARPYANNRDDVAFLQR